MSKRVKIRPIVTALFPVVLTFLVLGVVPSAVAKNEKQTICHRTGSSKNPYVVINPSKNAGGHSKHPDKNGHNDKKVPDNAPKGPTFKSGYGGCEGGGSTPPPPPGPPPGPPPPPGGGGGGGGGGNNNGGTPSNSGSPGGSGPFAAPAPAIVGEPSVTG